MIEMVLQSHPGQGDLMKTAWLLPRTLVVLALLAPLGCTTYDNPWKEAGNKPRVLVSFAPLDCFAQNVAGDDVAVKDR